MFKGPNKETKHTLLPMSMLLLKKEIEKSESKDTINDTDKISLRLMKTEYEILKRLNLDTNIQCIGKTIEEENFEIQHSILILDSLETVEVYNNFTSHIRDLIATKNIIDEILKPIIKENNNEQSK